MSCVAIGRTRFAAFWAALLVAFSACSVSGMGGVSPVAESGAGQGRVDVERKVVPAQPPAGRLTGRASGVTAPPTRVPSLPVLFEANAGQADESIKFFSRTKNYGLILKSSEAVFLLPNSRNGPGEEDASPDTVTMRLPGSNAMPVVEGLSPVEAVSNYLIGKDSARWRTGVPNFKRVALRGVYPNIDLVYKGSGDKAVEYDFIVAPGGDPSAIKVDFLGAKLSTDSKGALLIKAHTGFLRQEAPFIYQNIDGSKKSVSGRFRLLSESTYGFSLGRYDKSRPLIIDPPIRYSTYLGGREHEDITDIAMDSSGHMYVAGTTTSPVLPGPHAVVGGRGSFDAFVAKMTPDGRSLNYVTYLSGADPAGWERGIEIDVDPLGGVWMVGHTRASDFPLVHPWNHPSTATSGRGGAFIAKLSPDGRMLEFSTVFAPDIWVSAVVAAPNGEAYIGGSTRYTGPGWATANAYQRNCRVPSSNIGCTDVFVAKFSATDRTEPRKYLSYLGGPASDELSDMAVESHGGDVHLYLVGATGGNGSTNSGSGYPVRNAFQPDVDAQGLDGFLSVLNMDADCVPLPIEDPCDALVYSTYIGGHNGATFNGMELIHGCRAQVVGTACELAATVSPDSEGNAYVAGYTSSTLFPVTNNAYQSNRSSGGCYSGNPIACWDGFVVKVNTRACPSTKASTAALCPNSLVYSTYLGGGDMDEATGIAVDPFGRIYVSGHTSSKDDPATDVDEAFPTTPDALSRTLNGTKDVFVSQLSPDGSSLNHSTLLGGEGIDQAWASLLTDRGSLIITGGTGSSNFRPTPGGPGLAPPIQAAKDGGNDGFLVIFDVGLPGFPTIAGLSRTAGSECGGESLDINGSNFQGAAVKLDGVPQNVTIAPDGKKITLKTPPHKPGLVDIEVTTSTGSAKQQFLYLPAVLGCAPAGGGGTEPEPPKEEPDESSKDKGGTDTGEKLVTAPPATGGVPAPAAAPATAPASNSAHVPAPQGGPGSAVQGGAGPVSSVPAIDSASASLSAASAETLSAGWAPASAAAGPHPVLAPAGGDEQAEPAVRYSMVGRDQALQASLFGMAIAITVLCCAIVSRVESQNEPGQATASPSPAY